MRNRNEFFDQKGITQEYFYKRYNLSDRKPKDKSVNDLNFNQTFFDKDMNKNFVSHLNIHIDKNNQGSIFSEENINNKSD